MNRDYEPVSSPKGGGKTVRNILILALLAFVGGAIASGWAMTRFGWFGEEKTEVAEQVPVIAAAPPRPVEVLEQRIDEDGKVAPLPPPAPAPTTIEPKLERALAARVADLEDRLSRINVQAQAASGNAARAEGLLIAFAARRALDRGSALGYIEGQLRLRFGSAQPKAVNTIINASLNPVTLEDLRSRLDDLAPNLTTGRTEKGFWTDFRREMSELFVIRREGTPSPAPQQRLLRAHRFLESGRVDAAFAEVNLLPGKEQATEWMALARRYSEARRALDLIETAAVLETNQIRTSDGKQVDQPSPLAPVDAEPVEK